MIDQHAVERTIRHWREQWTVPGIVVGIWNDGVTTYFADGISNLRTGHPIRTDALFRVASISKVFTATLAMTLVDDGLLDLDEPVVSYLPELRLADSEARQTITMRHLLSHSSGLLGDFFKDFGLGADALSNAIDQFHTIRQLTRPGELWHYCNSGFHLAGRVISEILQTDFESAMRSRVFEPLGLGETGFYAHEMIVQPHAIGHVQVSPGADQHQVAPQYYPRNRNPAGGVLTSPQNLLRFAAMHLGNGEIDGTRVLSAESANTMRTFQIASGDFVDSWAVGWEIRDFSGTDVFGHQGSINGYQLQLTIVPDQNLALCVLTNSGRGRSAIDPIELTILEEQFGLVRKRPDFVDLSNDALARVSGNYQQPLAQITVTPEQGSLRIETREPHPVTGELVPYPSSLARPVDERRYLVVEGEGLGELIHFVFAEDADVPVFIRRHGRLHDRVGQ